VLSVPMWNFAYPYKLKQLIDLVCQRNMLFTYDGTEYGVTFKNANGASSHQLSSFSFW
jgi:FMN-dependent NADH-azoreductase